MEDDEEYLKKNQVGLLLQTSLIWNIVLLIDLYTNFALPFPFC